MKSFLIVYIVLIGLAIGSFLNVLIYRIPLKLSVSKGNSFCPKCNHKLSWLDLFPVFSYIFLCAKCRYCKAPISFRYPLVEIINAVCYLAIYLIFGLNLISLCYAVFCTSLIVLAFIDIDHKIIPDRFNIIIGICGILLLFLSHDIPLIDRITWLDRVIGLFAVSVPLLIIFLITGGMGEGDIKLFAVCGFFLGWKLILLTMLFASIFAAIFGIILMVNKKATRKSEIPFGPYIALAAIASLFFGNNLLNSYLSLFIK
jgi:leader peptidase (prepilin peptidase)/N-methyltransferase